MGKGQEKIKSKKKVGIGGRTTVCEVFGVSCCLLRWDHYIAMYVPLTRSIFAHNGL